jgi:mannosylglucosylglycerate synthase
MRIVIMHYSAPPVIGGVEAVIEAHAREFLRAGYPVTVVAGRGDQAALPEGADLIIIPEMDTLHPLILQINAVLELGLVPKNFFNVTDQIAEGMSAIFRESDAVFVHNLFTKHFNLPLTSALVRLVEMGTARCWIAWCHDISWTSPNSRSKVFEGEPWDMLRKKPARLFPVVVSRQRQAELANLYQIDEEEVRVVYNGVNPESLLGLSPAGLDLAARLDLFASDLVLLMPVRITKAKNIELAIQVTAELRQFGINPRLVVTGPPDPHDEQSMAYFQELKQLRSDLDVENEMRFVYELEAASQEIHRIGPELVGELYRVSDVMFMPSHREGFGMPVMEAGLVGIQVFSTGVPAANEIAANEVISFSSNSSAETVARQLINWADHDRIHQLRRQVRQKYTWQAIFRRSILPLLQETCML